MLKKLVVVCLVAAGCTERALEIPIDGGPRTDLRVADFADLADLASFDLAGDLRGPVPNPCPAGTQFIFTIDQDSTLSRFSPDQVAFFDVGTMSCPSTTAQARPNSMAIARDGNGYVNYDDGEFFRLLTATATCSSIPYQRGQGGLTQVGMSFAENTPGSVDETLWIADSRSNVPPVELASVDLTSYTLSSEIPIASGTEPELTGDDEANLFAFFPSDTPPRIARLDKKKGVADRVLRMPSIAGVPQAWGVAAWKGDFYVFLQRQGESSTTIYLVDGKTAAITPVLAATGRHIVGVGVATCAGNNGLDF